MMAEDALQEWFPYRYIQAPDLLAAAKNCILIIGQVNVVAKRSLPSCSSFSRWRCWSVGGMCYCTQRCRLVDNSSVCAELPCGCSQVQQMDGEHFLLHLKNHLKAFQVQHGLCPCFAFAGALQHFWLVCGVKHR